MPQATVGSSLGRTSSFLTTLRDDEGESVSASTLAKDTKVRLNSVITYYLNDLLI